MLFFFFFFGNDGVLQEASTDKVPFDMTPDEFEFFNDKIRYAWNREEQEWYFSIVDVLGVLTESRDPHAYWRKLKQRLSEEGNRFHPSNGWFAQGYKPLLPTRV